VEGGREEIFLSVLRRVVLICDGDDDAVKGDERRLRRCGL
jgi:hypothetical protein